MSPKRISKTEVRRIRARLNEEKESRPFNLSVEYPAEKFPILDTLIRKAVGRGAHSSGMDIKTPKDEKPKRDLVFGFASEKALNNAVKRVRKLKVKLPFIELSTWED